MKNIAREKKRIKRNKKKRINKLNEREIDKFNRQIDKKRERERGREREGGDRKRVPNINIIHYTDRNQDIDKQTQSHARRRKNRHALRE